MVEKVPEFSAESLCLRQGMVTSGRWCHMIQKGHVTPVGGWQLVCPGWCPYSVQALYLCCKRPIVSDIHVFYSYWSLISETCLDIAFGHNNYCTYSHGFTRSTRSDNSWITHPWMYDHSCLLPSCKPCRNEALLPGAYTLVSIHNLYFRYWMKINLFTMVPLIGCTSVNHSLHWH